MMLHDEGISGPNGIRRLVAFYRKQFRIPENLNHYSAKDLLMAERKFIKFALEDGYHMGQTESSASQS